MNEFAQIISQVGFPIAACAAMFWQNIQQDKRHAEESDKWAQTLTANTLAIQKLDSTLAAMEAHHDES